MTKSLQMLLILNPLLFHKGVSCLVVFDSCGNAESELSEKRVHYTGK